MGSLGRRMDSDPSKPEPTPGNGSSLAAGQKDPPADSSPAASRIHLATDRALARRAGLGDAESFGELFERHWFSTYHHALRMLDGDEHAAQDAAQEAWITAWRALPDFRGDSQVRTWLFTITYREVLRHRRRRRPHVVDGNDLAEALADAEAVPGDGSFAGAADPSTQAAGLEMKDALVLVLAELPWRQRATWLMRELDDFSYEEIARVLGTSTTVVRGQLHRARQTVAHRMESWR